MRSARPAARRPASRGRGVLVLLAAAALAACGSDGATAPDAPPSFDVERAFAGLAVPAGAGLAALGAGAGIGLPAGLGGLAGPGAAGLRGCAWDAGAQAFACAPVTAAGLTRTASYTPLDARGAPQPSPGRATTAAVRVVTTTDGTVAAPGLPGAPGGAFAVAGREEATVRGLLAGPRTLDAASTLTVRGAAGGVALRVTQTTAGLALSDAPSGWPSSGTVTFEVSDLAAGALARQVITFDGTSTVTVLATAAGLTRRCTLDLAAGPGSLRCVAG
jgi:hypothetical protein